jgi:hypothetical protein
MPSSPSNGRCNRIEWHNSKNANSGTFAHAVLKPLPERFPVTFNQQTKGPAAQERAAGRRAHGRGMQAVEGHAARSQAVRRGRADAAPPKVEASAVPASSSMMIRTFGAPGAAAAEPGAANRSTPASSGRPCCRRSDLGDETTAMAIGPWSNIPFPLVVDRKFRRPRSSAVERWGRHGDSARPAKLSALIHEYGHV